MPISGKGVNIFEVSFASSWDDSAISMAFQDLSKASRTKVCAVIDLYGFSSFSNKACPNTKTCQRGHPASCVSFVSKFESSSNAVYTLEGMFSVGMKLTLAFS